MAPFKNMFVLAVLDVLWTMQKNNLFLSCRHSGCSRSAGWDGWRTRSGWSSRNRQLSARSWHTNRIEIMFNNLSLKHRYGFTEIGDNSLFATLVLNFIYSNIRGKNIKIFLGLTFTFKIFQNQTFNQNFTFYFMIFLQPLIKYKKISVRLLSSL